MNPTTTEASLRPERDYRFGSSKTIDFMRSQAWYIILDTAGKARAEGWACGCPIVNQLIEARGAEAMLERYSEVNTVHGELMRELQVHNPSLLKLMTHPVDRLPEELPWLYEDESVPADYKEKMPVIGSLVGYALPRVMIELYRQQHGLIEDTDMDDCWELVQDELKKSRSPYELLARVSEYSYTLGVEPRDIFHHVFIEGWLDEHNATSVMAEAAAAFRQYAPKLFEKYIALTPEEWQEQELHMDFASVINHRAGSGEKIKSDTYGLMNHLATVDVRARGGVIIGCALEDSKNTQVVPILYCDDASKSKVSATHPMSPVGPSDGVGGQHGPWRWANFRRFPSGNENVIYMQAERGDVGESTMTRSVDLSDPSALKITSAVQSNKYEESEPTSLGEHAYFACKEPDIYSLLVDGKGLHEVLDGVNLDDIMAGEPYHWRNAPAEMILAFADGRTIKLSAEASVDGDAVSHDYLVWHRPGTDSICIEPVVGYVPGQAGRIILAPGALITLQTSIALIAAEQ